MYSKLEKNPANYFVSGITAKLHMLWTQKYQIFQTWEPKTCQNTNICIYTLYSFKFALHPTGDDARGTDYSNSVPAGIEFQNDHECEARGIHFSLGPSA